MHLNFQVTAGQTNPTTPLSVFQTLHKIPYKIPYNSPPFLQPKMYARICPFPFRRQASPPAPALSSVFILSRFRSGVKLAGTEWEVESLFRYSEFGGAKEVRGE